jgi:TonB family protein
MYNDETFWANIARNLANPAEEEFDIDDYIDQIKQELLESGEISEENYLDEMRRRLEQEASAGETEFQDKEQEEEVKTSDEIAAAYSGPTRIYYSLEGRIHTKLPLPIYKCEGSGKVILDITVNQRGAVVSATVNKDESSSDDFCLHEMALDAAQRSKFNFDPTAPSRQNGTLTYHFVAQ